MDYDALNEGEGTWDHDGFDGLGQDTATAQEVPWYEKGIELLTGITQAASQYQAAKYQAETGQVPTAQVNVGVAPETQKLAIGVGIGLLVIGALWAMKK
jgi:hypothetical protein